jgi:hypothetical protein
VQGLRQRGWRVLHHRRLAIVCFVDGSRRAAAPAALAARIAARGRAWLAATQVANQPALRACVSSYATTQGDIETLLDELDAARALEPSHD